MQIRCESCFSEYDEANSICPFCGYEHGEPGKELYHLLPGTMLNNRYIVGSAVGAGGFGITYKAWDSVLDTVIAIKEFYPVSMVTRAAGEKQVAVYSSKQNSEYAKGLEAFLREAKIMSLFADSENICKTYNYFKENGTAYIVMEFLEGKTIKDHLKMVNMAYTERELMPLAYQLMSGLSEIHKKGVIHCDIAPDNIWLTSEGNIKIIDFGASYYEKMSVDDDNVILKQGFAAPEHYRNDIGPWTDIYAAGATLYFLLTGVIPLEGSDREFNDTLATPAMICSCSQSFSNVIMRCMAVEKSLRYKSAEQVAFDLGRERVRSLEQELKARKRRRNSFIGIIAVVLVLAIGGGVIYKKVSTTISECEIVVWLVKDRDAGTDDRLEKMFEAKVAGYQTAIAHFNERYPQVTVVIEVKDADSVEKEFNSLSKKKRPDVIESVLAISDKGSTLSDSALKPMYESKASSHTSSKLVDGVDDYVKKTDGKKIPVGISIPVVYSHADAQALTEEINLNEFLSGKVGYCVFDSYFYYIVQEERAGLYRVSAAASKKIFLSECVSIYKKSYNNAKAAEAFVEYLLTDEGQDSLHISNKSGYMPVNLNALKEYLNVYSNDLNFFLEDMGAYSVEE